MPHEGTPIRKLEQLRQANAEGHSDNSAIFKRKALTAHVWFLLRKGARQMTVHELCELVQNSVSWEGTMASGKARKLAIVEDGDLGIRMAVILGQTKTGHLLIRRFLTYTGNWGRVVTINPNDVIRTIRQLRPGERLPKCSRGSNSPMKPRHQPKTKRAYCQALIDRINRKDWWHVPPTDPSAYSKRGKFLAWNYREAELYGRPNDEPEKVNVRNPLVGSHDYIAYVLGIPGQYAGMTHKQMVEVDRKWRQRALELGYDSIVLISASAFMDYQENGKIPRAMELNILVPRQRHSFVGKDIPSPSAQKPRSGRKGIL